eukprot:83809-Prymnesium_polylepis.1
MGCVGHVPTFTAEHACTELSRPRRHTTPAFTAQPFMPLRALLRCALQLALGVAAGFEATAHLPVCSKCAHAVSPHTGYKTARFPQCLDAVQAACDERPDAYSFCTTLASGADDYHLFMKLQRWRELHCEWTSYKPTEEEALADAQVEQAERLALGHEVASEAGEVTTSDVEAETEEYEEAVAPSTSVAASTEDQGTDDGSEEDHQAAQPAAGKAGV